MSWIDRVRNLTNKSYKQVQAHVYSPVNSLRILASSNTNESCNDSDPTYSGKLSLGIDLIVSEMWKNSA